METSSSATDSFGERFRTLLRTQASANFAMVMSTGIVSVALHLLGIQSGAWLLFIINIGMFALLCVLYPLRLFIYPKEFADDFMNHGKGPGFLTIVAGTCILGNQYALLAGEISFATMLFWGGVACWIVILWGVFYFIFSRNPKPPIEGGINGAWLVATVSTQAIVILGSILLDKSSWDQGIALFTLTTLFLLGLMLYIIVITMIFYRFAYKDLHAEQLSPTYWINTGAVAITTLAGSELIVHAGHSAFLMDFMPFIKGATLLAWATASWWLPMLLLLGFWRHFRQGFPFTYTAEYWGMVFPMGMYTACTIMLSKALGLPFLMEIPRYFIFVACIAWIATFLGMIWATGKALFTSQRQGA